jgi:glycosyltransferase involved in cell wall biosynthesis
VSFVNTGPIVYRNQVPVIHDLAYLRFPEAFVWRFRRYYGFVIPQLIARARGLIVNSEFTKHEVMSTFEVSEDKVRVVYPFVSPALVTLPRATSRVGRPYALTVSSLNRRKNLGTVLRAFQHLHDLVLIVVGEHRRVFRAENFRDLAPSQVRFVGRVSDEELWQLYAHAEVFVYASLYEGFGIPPIEAMAAGCPVVVSKVASLPEACGDAAHYVNPLDPLEIADGVCTVVTDTAYRQTLVKRGLQRARRFTHSRSLQTLKAILDEWGSQ